MVISVERVNNVERTGIGYITFEYRGTLLDAQQLTNRYSYIIDISAFSITRTYRKRSLRSYTSTQKLTQRDILEEEEMTSMVTILRTASVILVCLHLGTSRKPERG